MRLLHEVVTPALQQACGAVPELRHPQTLVCQQDADPLSILQAEAVPRASGFYTLTFRSAPPPKYSTGVRTLTIELSCDFFMVLKQINFRCCRSSEQSFG